MNPWVDHQEKDPGFSKPGRNGVEERDKRQERGHKVTRVTEGAKGKG